MALSQERWEQILAANSWADTVEQVRDAVEGPGWREREAKLKLAEENCEKAPREVPENLGKVAARPSRQVNVKLSVNDFDGLVALAVDRDLAPSSMARVLLRNAIREALRAAGG